jgi:hypothetical protein
MSRSAYVPTFASECSTASSTPSCATARTFATWTASLVPPSSWTLATDLRFQLFAVVFAVGTIAHELGFLLEVVAVGPLTEYMERWGRAVPTLPLPSWGGLALHLGDIAIALCVLVVRRKREGLCLLAVVFLASQLASPNRSASHNSLMIGGLLMVLALALGEWGERLVTHWRHRRPRIDWLRVTLRGLAGICALTYFFAFFYKLNREWFSASSGGLPFLTRPLAPILTWLDAPAASAAVGAVSIYGTLLLEVALPCLLFLPRTRRLGCFLGAGFHLPMLMQRVIDFPVLILAFYPAFLESGEAAALRGWLRHPPWRRLVAAAALGGYGLWVLAGAPKSGSIATRGLPWIPWVVITDAVLAGAVLVLGTYVTLALGAWWWAGVRRRPAAVEPGLAQGAPASTGPAVALALAVGALCTANQLAPFFRLPAVGPLTMFSSISPDYRNHLILPGIPLVAAFEYVRLLRFEAEASETGGVRELQIFVRDNQRLAIHLNVLRYHLDRICEAAPGRTVRVEWVPLRGGERRAFEDVCAEPGLRWYLPLPVAHSCVPRCFALIHRWAKGESPR